MVISYLLFDLTSARSKFLEGAAAILYTTSNALSFGLSPNRMNFSYFGFIVPSGIPFICLAVLFAQSFCFIVILLGPFVLSGVSAGCLSKINESALSELK